MQPSLCPIWQTFAFESNTHNTVALKPQSFAHATTSIKGRESVNEIQSQMHSKRWKVCQACTACLSVCVCACLSMCACECMCVSVIQVSCLSWCNTGSKALKKPEGKATFGQTEDYIPLQSLIYSDYSHIIYIMVQYWIVLFVFS